MERTLAWLSGGRLVGGYTYGNALPSPHYGPLHTRDCEPVTIVTLQALSLGEKAEPVQVRYFTLRLREGPPEYVKCKMDVKSTWIPTWHQMDHVFMVTWIIFKNHLVGVGLALNQQETMALRTLTTFRASRVVRVMWALSILDGIHILSLVPQHPL